MARGPQTAVLVFINEATKNGATKGGWDGKGRTEKELELKRRDVWQQEHKPNSENRNTDTEENRAWSCLEVVSTRSVTVTRVYEYA